MKLLNLFFVSSLLLLQACSPNDTTTTFQNGHQPMNVVPIPKTVSVDSSRTEFLVLGQFSRIFLEDQSLLPIIERWRSDMETVYGFKLEVTNRMDETADVIFKRAAELEAEQHRISIGSTIEVTAGSLQAIAQACASLLQLASVEEGGLAFPLLDIEDGPDASYRGLMLDLARNWHTIKSIKQCIDLAAFYKSNFVHLHFTDYQSFTLPSKAFPKLSTLDRHYTFAELEDLEAYAKTRGVILIPEIDVPGHASSIVEAYPEIFGIENRKGNPYIINMGKEKVYTAIETIIGEIAPIFKSSPYFHIGGDEAIFDFVLEDSEVQEYMKTHDLGDDVHELYRHFLVRVDSMVRRQGKQTCVWEGFRPDGKVDLPKDIIVFEFETNRYLPQQLIDDGYTVVNTSWKPLYVVNKKKFSPASIYQWNRWNWGNWWPRAPSYTPIQIESTDQVIGGQMCSWEQAEGVELPSIRKRLPVMNERLWNSETQQSLEEFLTAIEATDSKLSLLLGDSRQDSLFRGYDWTAEMEKK